MHCVEESGCEGEFNPFSIHVVFAIATFTCYSQAASGTVSNS